MPKNIPSYNAFLQKSCLQTDKQTDTGHTTRILAVTNDTEEVSQEKEPHMLNRRPDKIVAYYGNLMKSHLS